MGDTRRNGCRSRTYEPKPLRVTTRPSLASVASAARHARDTRDAVAGLCDPDTVAALAAGAPGADGRSATLWALNPQGRPAMSAEATFTP